MQHTATLCYCYFPPYLKKEGESLSCIVHFLFLAHIYNMQEKLFLAAYL